MNALLRLSAQRFYHRYAGSWPAWLLAGSATLLMGFSLEEARWVENNIPLIASLLWGVVFGALLAQSRFSGWFSLLYCQMIALAFILQALGSVLPSLPVLTTLSALESFAQANARMLLLSERIQDWLTALIAGQSVRDTGLFILFTAWLAWNASAWLMWAFLRRRQALQGVLPYGALFGLNMQLSNQTPWLFVAFIVLGMLMAAHSEFSRRQSGWDHNSLDYPDELGIGWGSYALLLAVGIALSARLLIFIATPEGWLELEKALRPLRQTVEDTSSRWFADINPPRYNPTEQQTPAPSAQTPQLGLVGSAPAQGDAIVMWVSTDGPPPPPPELEERGIVSNAVPVRYWRSEIFAAYTGLGWQTAELDSAPAPPAPLDTPPPANPPDHAEKRIPLTQTYDILANHGAELFAANAPWQASPGLSLRLTLPDASALLTGKLSSYTVRSRVTHVTENDLQSAAGSIPAQISAAYLQLPASLPARVPELAARLTISTATPYEKALRIQNYLRSTYPYKLDTPPPPTGMDAVDYFLFQAPGGFCSYYASAMAVMLRSQGVPARVVSGYAMGRFDYDRQAYAVRVSDAHAWVEVYFPNLGWVEFEPTAGLAAIEYEKGGTAGILPAQPVPPPPNPPFTFPWAIISLSLFIIFALGGLFYLLLRKTGAALTPAAQIEVLYRHIRVRLGWAKLQATASVTPTEFNTTARRNLPPGHLSTALQQATTLYEEALYSSHPPTPCQVTQAHRLWHRARWEWLKTWLRSHVNL